MGFRGRRYIGGWNLTEIALAVSTYNYLRPHYSIDMLTPAVAHTKIGVLKRRWKNYYRPKEDQKARYAAV